MSQGLVTLFGVFGLINSGINPILYSLTRLRKQTERISQFTKNISIPSNSGTFSIYKSFNLTSNNSPHTGISPLGTFEHYMNFKGELRELTPCH